MADVLHRTTLQFLTSVNTPDYPSGTWVINPDMSPVAGVPQKYWKLTGDVVSEMSQAEKDVVDAAADAPAPLRSGGGLVIEPLDTPSAPTVEAQGTTGSTTWAYKITAFSDTGETLASTAAQITDGNATLSNDNYNEITWSTVSGAVSYGVYRSTAGGTPSSTGFLIEVEGVSYSDKGKAGSGSEPSEDLSGGLLMGTGTGESQTKLATIKELTSDTSTVTSLLRLIRQSSGTVQAGFGTGLYMVLEDAGGTLRDAGSMHFRWDDPAAGTLHSKARIQLRDGGTSADKDFEVNHDGEVTFDGTTLIKQDTCVLCFSLDEGIRGGNASSSSNNGIASITFDDIGESRIRWNRRPPKNYISGDMTLKVRGSVSSSTSSDMRLELQWQTLADGDAIPASYPNTSAQTFDLNGLGGDNLFDVDFTLGSSTFDTADDMMAFYLLRDGDHAADTTTLTLHIHQIELHYTGWAFAGQPGQ